MNAPLGTELQQLRDVHPPPAASLWPPAPGWWLLWALGLALIAWASARAYARRQRSLPWRAALHELDRIEASTARADERLQAIALLLRRLALRHHDDAAAIAAEDLPALVFGVADDTLADALRARFVPTDAPADAAVGARLRALLEQAARGEVAHATAASARPAST